MNKKSFKIITLTLFLISSFGVIQHLLKINNLQNLKAQGNPPPPPPPPPPPMTGPGGKVGILTRAILTKIAKGADLTNNTQKIIAELKDANKAKTFFGLLVAGDNVENIRQFLDSNGFGIGTETRDAFEQKFKEKIEASTDQQVKPKKPSTHGGQQMASSEAILIKNLISLLNKPDNIINLSDTSQIQRLLDLDVIKKLEDQPDTITLDGKDYKKTDISAVKTALEERKKELEEEELAQEEAKHRKAEIDKSISQNVKQLVTLSSDNIDDFVAAFTFPDPIQPNLTPEEKKEIITKSWLNYTGFKTQSPYESKKKALFYVILFKIYNFTEIEFNTKFNTHAGTTKFNYYINFFPGDTNLAKQFARIKDELNKINATVNDIKTVLDFWGNLKLSTKPTDLANQLPQTVINRLKVILTEDFLQNKITSTNKEDIKKIVQALFKDSDISDSLKTKLGIKKTIKIGGTKTPSEQIQDLQKKFSQITDVSYLSITQNAELGNIQKMPILLQELQLTEKPTVEGILAAIKAYKTPEPGAPGTHPKPGHGTPPPMPARPFNQQLKTLKTNLTQLKGKLATLNTKLTALRGAL